MYPAQHHQLDLVPLQEAPRCPLRRRGEHRNRCSLGTLNAGRLRATEPHTRSRCRRHRSAPAGWCRCPRSGPRSSGQSTPADAVTVARHPAGQPPRSEARSAQFPPTPARRPLPKPTPRLNTERISSLFHSQSGQPARTPPAVSTSSGQSSLRCPRGTGAVRFPGRPPPVTCAIPRTSPCGSAHSPALHRSGWVPKRVGDGHRPVRRGWRPGSTVARSSNRRISE